MSIASSFNDQQNREFIPDEAEESALQALVDYIRSAGVLVHPGPCGKYSMYTVGNVGYNRSTIVSLLGKPIDYWAGNLNEFHPKSLEFLVGRYRLTTGN